MEIGFDNPGHREELEKLGILQQGESQIVIEDLIHKTIESKNVEPVMYILRQQLANNYQGLLFIDDRISRTKKDAFEISDKTSLGKVQSRLDQIIDILDKATVQSDKLTISANTIMNELQSKTENASLLTPLVSEHFNVINQTQKQMLETLEQKGRNITQDIQVIESTIDNWTYKLQS